jgi:hypothetical protein
VNERIKELIVESNNGLMRDGKCYPHIGSRDLGDWQRFAELIVRECVIRAEREWIRNGSDTEHNKAITSVIKSIKEHFGVES